MATNYARVLYHPHRPSYLTIVIYSSLRRPLIQRVAFAILPRYFNPGTEKINADCAAHTPTTMVVLR
jgi:hypothetical protein